MSFIIYPKCDNDDIRKKILDFTLAKGDDDDDDLWDCDCISCCRTQSRIARGEQ